jgi:hypothetical protein
MSHTAIAGYRVDRSRRSLILRALLASFALVAAGCWADGPGFQVQVDNRSSRDFVVLFDGVELGELTTPPSETGFLASAGSAADGPWVTVDRDERTGAFEKGAVSIYTLDCDMVATFQVDLGSHLLAIDVDGIPTIAPRDRNDQPGDPYRLPLARAGCP